MFIKYSFIKTLEIIILFSLLVGCGWFFDENGVVQESEIIGNIKIRNMENKSFDLVFYETKYMISPIFRNCSVVYYDSLKNIIWAEEILNKYNSTFYKVQINDAATNIGDDAVTKTVITPEEFYRSTNDKMKKWSIDKDE